MRIVDLTLRAYGACTDVEIPLGPGVTVVLGGNESGKSTALDALGDLLWGIPLRSTRAFVHARGALRIDATIDDAGTQAVVVRRAGGLLAPDLVTHVPAPWDPSGDGSAEWWRTRMGLTLDQLRAGGREVFAGGGDLAEAVFAAREGRSARLLLQSLTERREALFKGDRRARSVRIRDALAAYDAARELRDTTVTRSGAVSSARERVELLTRELDEARDVEAAVDRRVRVAEEDARAIPHVRAIVTARALLAEIGAEGARLSEADLLALRDAGDAAARARVAAAQISARIDGLEASRRELVVDDELLRDAGIVDRLRVRAGERTSEVRRAEEEFAPIVREEQAKLEALVGRLGRAAGDDLEALLDSLELPTPLQAEITRAAESLERADDELAGRREQTAATLATLLGRGMEIDPAIVVRTDLFDARRVALIEALAALQTCTEVLTRARARLVGAREGGASGAPVVDVAHTDVLATRAERDAAWMRLSTAWLEGDLPADRERRAWAEAVDHGLQAADALADREAQGRAALSAHDARLGEQEARVEAAALDVSRAEEEHDDTSRRVEEAEQAWRAAWQGIGVPDAPGVDAAPELLGLISAAVEQQARTVAAERAADEARRSWRDSSARAALPEGTTPAAWRERASVLSQLTASRQARDFAAAREVALREAWSAFSAEVADLLTRHDALDEARVGDDSRPLGEPLEPVAVDRGLEILSARSEAATSADRERRALDDRLRELVEERHDLEEAVADELVLRRELARAYGTDAESGLDALMDRAARADEPLRAIASARSLLEGALDAGSAPDDVIVRLQDGDPESVARALRSALEAQVEAREQALAVAGARSEAAAELRAHETAGSAADAEAAVAERLSDLVALTEEWSVLTVQVALLERTLERIGSDDTRPLLDHAGRILERITDGRYLALRAEETSTGRTLQVVRADGDRVSPAELSEGTGDQVFFALRMAAVAELHEQRRAAGLPALPLVLDDVLMAFDDVRALDALAVLHELADGLQIVVFTHHASVADAARQLDGIVVSSLPAPTTIDEPLDGELVRATAQRDATPATLPAPLRSAIARDARDERSAARAWAQAQGIPVAARGRVPEEILEQYRATRR